jgi:50S ribosomal subunit-associated GTPase HflX
MLSVFNKIDLLSEDVLKALQLDIEEFHSPYVLVSAKSKDSLKGLKQFLLDYEPLWSKGKSITS